VTGNDSKPWTGAFARYIAVKGDLELRVLASVGFEAASTVGVGSASAAYALYKVLGLPFRRVSELKEPVFIYGGSTATRTLAIQFAKL
jgi:NADPH:quinone reductase-like Zn-dependent oxidoreductase